MKALLRKKSDIVKQTKVERNLYVSSLKKFKRMHFKAEEGSKWKA